MIDFNLNIIEGTGNLVVRASADNLGEAFFFPSSEEREDLDRIRLQTEGLLEARDPGLDLFDLGRKLFDLIFRGDVRTLYQKAWATSEDPGRGPLRILLRMASESPLQDVPWEILHDGYRALARDARATTVRYLEQPTPVDNLEVEAPLRVLVTTANPMDLSPLAAEQEVGLIRLAYKEAGPLVDLTVEESISLNRLEEIWRRAASQGEPFHVWHHCGHGGKEQLAGSTEFRLYLENHHRREPVEVERLQDLVSFCPQLRVAILNVCHAGSTAGLVPALSRLRVPVVIGFKHAVSDSAALRFAGALHEGLLYNPIEWAVNAARKSMKINHPEAPDWNHAVVISRRKDRGGLLKPVRREQEEFARNPAKKRGNSSISVDMKLKVVKAESFESIGTNIVGNVSIDPGRSAKIRMSVDQLEAIRVTQIGYQALEGFAPNQIESREVRLREFVEAMDRYLSEMA